MSVKAVIFDWAGTTVDYGSFAPVGAFIETFRARGIEPTPDEVREPMGMLKIEHIRTMLQMERITALWHDLYGRNYTEEDLLEMYQHYEKCLLEVLPRYADVKPYILETAEVLRANSIRIGSTTGYTDKMMKIVVPIAGKNGYTPDFWCSPDSVKGKGRPYPYMIYENMKALGVMSVKDIIKIGDTISDIHEGKNAGVYTIGIIEGSSEMGLAENEYRDLTREQKLSRINTVSEKYIHAGADKVLLNMGELLPLLEELWGV